MGEDQRIIVHITLLVQNTAMRQVLFQRVHESELIVFTASLNSQPNDLQSTVHNDQQLI